MIKNIFYLALLWLVFTLLAIAIILRIGYNVSLEGILFHLRFGTTLFTGNTMYWQAIYVLVSGLVVAVAVFLILKILFPRWYDRAIGLFGLGVIIGAGHNYEVGDYIVHRLSRDDFYQQNYQRPEVKFTSSERPNLILLFLESVEQTFTRPDIFGQNMLPELNRLQSKGVSFDNYQQTSGTWWTMGAVVGAWCGIPLTLPLVANDIYDQNHFLSRAVCLSDVLTEQGYNMFHVRGSASKFAGLNLFLQDHGFMPEDVLDFEYFLSLRSKGFDNFVDWGAGDSSVYNVFKQKIVDASKQERPFFASMQTINTHFPFTTLDKACSNGLAFSNAMRCSDQQAAEFIEWFLKQSFAKDTVLVVIGDHLFMEKIADLDYNFPQKGRRIFNLFINSRAKPEGGTARGFTALDIFPSILESLGMEIPNHRAGLGVSAFAPQSYPTLLEQMGEKKLNDKLLNRSKIYESFL